MVSTDPSPTRVNLMSLIMEASLDVVRLEMRGMNWELCCQGTYMCTGQTRSHQLIHQVPFDDVHFQAGRANLGGVCTSFAMMHFVYPREAFVEVLARPAARGVPTM
jgi:hypothetical protein